MRAGSLELPCGESVGAAGHRGGPQAAEQVSAATSYRSRSLVSPVQTRPIHDTGTRQRVRSSH